GAARDARRDALVRAAVALRERVPRPVHDHGPRRLDARHARVVGRPLLAGFAAPAVAGPNREEGPDVDDLTSRRLTISGRCDRLLVVVAAADGAGERRQHGDAPGPHRDPWGSPWAPLWIQVTRT